MNTTSPNDLRLRSLLREWKPDATVPPHFQESVWQRIERADTARSRPTSGWWDCLGDRLLQPKWATAGLLTVLLLGGFSGFTIGADPAQSVAQVRYVAAVDPYHKGH